MRQVVYYVATSLDGYICGPSGDISGFVPGGNGIDKYLEDLKGFDSVIMGRNTYEFGYGFGLKPGQPAYPGKMNYIFSNSLQLGSADPSVRVCRLDLRELDTVINRKGTDIYLCGGGQLAGWLLDHQRIHVLKIKLNPLVLGGGVKLFGGSGRKVGLELTGSEQFEHGLQILTFKIAY